MRLRVRPVRAMILYGGHSPSLSPSGHSLSLPRVPISLAAHNVYRPFSHEIKNQLSYRRSHHLPSEGRPSAVNHARNAHKPSPFFHVLYGQRGYAMDPPKRPMLFQTALTTATEVKHAFTSGTSTESISFCFVGLPCTPPTPLDYFVPFFGL
jgi:hypothetical protein